MKVGIYAKHLNTLGGGERVATVMAYGYARAGHEVDLISGHESDKKLAEKILGVNLSKVSLITWYSRSYQFLKEKTKKYDLFINTSFLDHLPSKAKRSFYYVHFPTPIRRTLFGLIKYETLLPFLRRYLLIPEISKGITPVEEVFARGGKWLENKTTIIFSNAPRIFKLKIRLYIEQFTLPQIDDIKFSSANSKIEVLDRLVDHHNNVVAYTFSIKSENDDGVAFTIDFTKDAFKHPIALVSLTIANVRFFMWNIIKRYFPRYEMAIYGSSSFKPEAGLDTYDKLFSNSKFTQKWTQKYWDKKSTVLYPPVDVHNFKPGKKEKIILNVGRFFVGGHSKRQDVLARAFVLMKKKGLLSKDWTLYLVGGISQGLENVQYLEKIKMLAKDHNIRLLHSVPYSELLKIYAKASIYWHATGYEVNEKVDPISMEHFGITPVEAMAAGCIPFLFKGGGLTEIVEHDSGFTWKTMTELQDRTKDVISDKRTMEKYSKMAQKRAQYFSREKFIEKLLEESKA